MDGRRSSLSRPLSICVPGDAKTHTSRVDGKPATLDRELAAAAAAERAPLAA
jgi:hypothetical protein